MLFIDFHKGPVSCCDEFTLLSTSVLPIRTQTVRIYISIYVTKNLCYDTRLPKSSMEPGMTQWNLQSSNHKSNGKPFIDINPKIIEIFKQEQQINAFVFNRFGQILFIQCFTTYIFIGYDSQMIIVALTLSSLWLLITLLTFSRL